MKRLFLISASAMITAASFAQTDVNPDKSLYNFDNQGSPKAVRKLGTAPEFPFLRHMTSAHQVYEAIKKHEDDNTAAMNKLNDLLMQIGYTNGAKDLQESDITMSYIKPGTEGNMGSRGYVYGYYQLEGNPLEFKAWKIAPNNSNASSGTVNSSMYLFAKCGNAFYPKTDKTACISVPVQVTPDQKQVNLQSSGSETTTENKVFVYYSRRHHRRGQPAYPVAGLDVKYPSKPIKVDADKEMDVVPETYTVTLSSPETSVTACPDSTLNLTASINVEKTSTYTGNYPNDDHKVYKKVSKRHYMMIARKMRKAERKANKIARRTGVPVDAKFAKS